MTLVLPMLVLFVACGLGCRRLNAWVLGILLLGITGILFVTRLRF